MAVDLTRTFFFFGCRAAAARKIISEFLTAYEILVSNSANDKFDGLFDNSDL